MNFIDVFWSFMACTGLFRSSYLLGRYINNRLIVPNHNEQKATSHYLVFHCCTGLSFIIILILHMGIFGFLYQGAFHAASWFFICVTLVSILLAILKYPAAKHKLLSALKNIGPVHWLITVVISGFLVIHFFIASFPELYSDPLRYHLQLAKFWLENNDIFFIQHFIPYSALPLNQTLLNLFAVSSFGDAMAHFYNCFFLVGNLICLYKITSHFSTKLNNSSAPILAALCFITMPVVFFVSISAMCELGGLFFCFASWLLIINSGSLNKTGVWILLGLYWGIAFGIKPSYLTMIFIIFIIAFLDQGRHKPISFFVCTGVFFLVSYYIYPVRSIIETGNPIWPMLPNIFGDAYSEFKPFYNMVFRGVAIIDKSPATFINYVIEYFYPRFQLNTLSFAYIFLAPIAIFALIYQYIKGKLTGNMKAALFVVVLCLLLPYINYLLFGKNSRKFLLPFLCMSIPIFIAILYDFKATRILLAIIFCVNTPFYSYLIYGQLKVHTKYAIEHYTRSDDWDSYLLFRKSNYYNLAAHLNNLTGKDIKVFSWNPKLTYYLNKQVYIAAPLHNFGFINYESFKNWQELYNHLTNDKKISHIIIPSDISKQGNNKHPLHSVGNNALSLLNQIARFKGKKLLEAKSGNLILYQI